MKNYTICKENGDIIGVLAFEVQPPFSTEKMYTGGFCKPKLNFETDEFYDSATAEEIQQFTTQTFLDKIRSVYENKYFPDGVAYYNSFMDKIVLTIRSGQLTNEQGVIIKEYLGKGFSQLKRDGDWVSAKYFIEIVDISENHFFVSVYKDEALAFITDYIAQNYPS